jgi:hypothetical protein
MVEIVAEFENWRKIRDWQGASGWVHQSLLTGKRSFIIPAKAASLHKTPAKAAEVVAKLEPEVMGEIRSCSGDWCRVRAAGVSGWLERTGSGASISPEPGSTSAARPPLEQRRRPTPPAPPTHASSTCAHRVGPWRRRCMC